MFVSGWIVVGAITGVGATIGVTVGDMLGWTVVVIGWMFVSGLIVVGAMTGAGAGATTGATVGATVGEITFVIVGDNVLMVVGAITGAIVGDTVGATFGATVGAMMVVNVGDNALVVVVVRTGVLGNVVNDFDVVVIGEIVAGCVVATGAIAPVPVSNPPDFNVVVGLIAPTPPIVLAVPNVVLVPPVASGVSPPFAPIGCKVVAPSFVTSGCLASAPTPSFKTAPACGTILGSSLLGAIFKNAGIVANIFGAALPMFGTKPAWSGLMMTMPLAVESTAAPLFTLS